MCHEKHDTHTHEPVHQGSVQLKAVFSEILCHLPYAIFAVAFSMLILSILSFLSYNHNQSALCYRLFHIFHFMHLLFAATGTMLTFRRFSTHTGGAILTSFFVPVIFCTISDAFLPYLGGQLIGLKMQFHWCFLSHLDTILPFLFVGMLNGWITSGHPSNIRLFYSIGFHFLHILISSMAAILYLVSFGFVEWWAYMSFVFLFLIFAVLVPCTLSDIVIPIIFAHFRKKTN